MCALWTLLQLFCLFLFSNKGETADRYFELRYNPNWKEDEEGAGHVEFKKSYPDDDKSSPNLSVSSTCSSSPFRFIPKNSHFKEQPPNAPSEFGTQFSPSCEQQSANVGSGSTNRTKEGDLPATGQSSCIPTAFSNGSSVQTKIFKQQRAEKYFVEKNKLTLGFAVQKNTSYLQLHDKRKKESGPGQVGEWPRIICFSFLDLYLYTIFSYKSCILRQFTGEIQSTVVKTIEEKDDTRTD